VEDFNAGKAWEYVVSPPADSEPEPDPEPVDDGMRSVQMWTPNQSDAQRWVIEGGEDDFALRNVACGKLLTLRTDTEHDGCYPVCVGDDGTMEQRWQLSRLDEGPDHAMRLLHVGDPSLMLDVCDGDPNPGTGVQARTDSGSAWANRFQLVWAGADSTYFVHSLSSDMCLDVVNGGA